MKGIQIVEEEVKLSPFADGMIFTYKILKTPLKNY